MPPTPPPEPEWPMPTLNLRVDALNHEGATIFFDSVHPTTALRAAVLASFQWLYATPECAPRNVASILLVLRSMDGVAYTTGSHTEKEIHFSLEHIVNSKTRARDEILGVLVHEVVHCYQHNGNGTAPGGLIEGFADYVRLHAGLSPPHWKREVGKNQKWDAGYQTTGYFLDWIDQRAGAGTVRGLNALLDGKDYEEAMFERLAGERVQVLWRRYKIDLAGGDPDAELAVEESTTDEGFTLV
ncbi:hypothetical protein FB45DRAFT_949306 [Roridomyces roridus]|uniref:Plant basic secretory protein n=1 Tax=Roridomyces roridus TaxID=1738132 RepID=A0AAD7B193_9AGAR|nr:hypothetical protein FB45DRAFT_949306 [Roridomyces roridus]